jgi:metallo-beta-lactamase class B
VGKVGRLCHAGPPAARAYRGKYGVVILGRGGGKKYEVLIAPSMSVNPGVKLINNKEWPGVADAYMDSFRKLRTLKCDVFLAPHAGFFDLAGKIERMNAGAKPNPFIDAEGFRKYVDQMEKAFDDERKKQLLSQKSGE